MRCSPLPLSHSCWGLSRKTLRPSANQPPMSEPIRVTRQTTRHLGTAPFAFPMTWKCILGVSRWTWARNLTILLPNHHDGKLWVPGDHKNATVLVTKWTWDTMSILVVTPEHVRSRTISMVDMLWELRLNWCRKSAKSGTAPRIFLKPVDCKEFDIRQKDAFRWTWVKNTILRGIFQQMTTWGSAYTSWAWNVHTTTMPLWIKSNSSKCNCNFTWT